MPGSIADSFVKSIVDLSLHSLLGDRFAVITVVGRKTGQQYSTPINVTRDGDVFTATSLRNRTWWRNLRGGRLARLRVSGREYSVHGDVLEDQDEVVAGLAACFAQQPNDAKYFGVRFDAAGRPAKDDLRRAADERVVIHLRQENG
jgi:deazaflavin-dependent oxidoreductase (nitroreductase family)